MTRLRGGAALALAAIASTGSACSACNRTAPDPGADPASIPSTVTIPPAPPVGSPAPWATTVASAPMPSGWVAPAASGDAGSPGTAPGTVVQNGGRDPLHGRFTLADATAGLPGSGQLTAHILTSRGPLDCKLYDDKAPITVANFVGLARGLRPWKNPSGQWVKEPIYDGTTFHRIIRGFMIQGGDPLGDGTGEPGFTFADEIWPGAKHDRAGLLCMANRGANTNGAQFFITDGAAPHLDGGFTIFGECAPIARVHDLASTPVEGDKPDTPPQIIRVTVTR